MTNELHPGLCRIYFKGMYNKLLVSPSGRPEVMAHCWFSICLCLESSTLRNTFSLNKLLVEL